MFEDYGRVSVRSVAVRVAGARLFVSGSNYTADTGGMYGFCARFRLLFLRASRLRRDRFSPTLLLRLPPAGRERILARLAFSVPFQPPETSCKIPLS